MNQKEYAEYQANVAMNLEDLNSVSTGPISDCSLCPDFDEDDDVLYDLLGEHYFSWASCELCFTPYGGNRVNAHGWNEDNTLTHLVICTDCEYYLEYDRLDDESMMEIESS